MTTKLNCRLFFHLKDRYQEVGVNAIFETFPNIGPDPTPAQDKVVELLKSCVLENKDSITQSHY